MITPHGNALKIVLAISRSEDFFFLFFKPLDNAKNSNIEFQLSVFAHPPV